MSERDYGNRHPDRVGCGCGCSSTLAVLTVGLGLALLNAGASIGISARIPFTDSNITLMGCVGEKNKAIEALPEYAKTKIGDNHNFINATQSTTIGPIEGCGVLVVGKQEGAPELDLHLVVK